MSDRPTAGAEDWKFGALDQPVTGAHPSIAHYTNEIRKRDREIHALRADLARVTQERDTAIQTGNLEGHGEPCYYCGEPTDTQRLDWLEQMGFSTKSRPGRGASGVHSWPDDCESASERRWTARWISSGFKTAREAIDAAMQAQKEKA